MKLTLALLRGWSVPSVVALTLGCAVTLSFLPVMVPLPRVFTGADLLAPLASIGALFVAIAAFSSGQEPSDLLLATAPRLVRWANPVRVLVVCAVGAAALTAVGPEHPLAVTSPVAALAGEGLLIAGFTSLRFAWTLPTMHVIVALTFGAAGRIDLAPWAWVISRTPSASAATASTILFAAGFVAWSTRHRRHGSTLE